MDKTFELNSSLSANDFVLQSAKTEGLSNNQASNMNGNSRDYLELRLNQREKTSINALVAYVAFTKTIREDAVLRMLCGRFRATELDAIRSVDYDDAVRFLVDFCDSQAAAN